MIIITFILLAYFVFIISSVAIDITDVNGKVYKNVEVTRIERNGISIKHDNGIASIPFNELPPDIRSKYQPIHKSNSKTNSVERWILGDDLDDVRLIEAGIVIKEIKEREIRDNKPIEENEKQSIFLERVNKYNITGKVLSVTKDGILLSDVELARRQRILVLIDGKPPPIPDGEKTEVVTKKLDGPVFIVGVKDKNIYDGRLWADTVYECGTYQYQAVLGQTKTVRCFALSVNDAILWKKNSK